MIADLKPYPAMKDSGVEWLGNVPEHWKPIAVKRHYSIQLGKMLQNSATMRQECGRVRATLNSLESVRVICLFVKVARAGGAGLSKM